MPNENVYTEAHGFKFPNGTTIPIEDAEARQDISEIKQSLSDLTTFEKTASGAIATFDDGNDLPMPRLKVGIEPQQDLHGYDAPWAGGAGKNLLPMTVESIKSKNTTGTWNNNVYTKNDMSFEILTDGANNVTGIKVNGTRNVSSPVYFTIGTFDFAANETYKVNGGVDLPSPIPVYFAVNGGVTVISSADYTQTFTSDTTKDVIIVVERTQQISNVIFHPMIRLASVTDPTFAPYSNICPISGHTGVNAVVVGKNLFGGLPMAQEIARCGYNVNLDTTNKIVTFTRPVALDGDYERILSENYKFKNNTSYTFVATYSNTANNAALRFKYSDGTNTEIPLVNSNGQKITIIAKTASYKNLKEIVMNYYVAGQTNLYYEESGLFEGVITAQDFEPYNSNSQTIQVSWQTEAGDVFGGYVDLVSGELVMDRAFVDLGSLSWSVITNSIFGATVNGLKTYSYGNTPDMLCSVYKIAPSSYNDPYISANGIIWAYVGVSALRIKDTAYSDATAFQTAMNGVQLVYPLATPLTIQLTLTQVKSLLGVNNIWADTGDLELTYFVNNNLVQAIYDMVNILTS